MTDSQNTPDIEDRDANIRLTIQHIIDNKVEEMCAEFDRLHRRGIHDDDVVKALRYLGDIELLDDYAEWAEIDLREDDNTTTSPVVPDPGDAPSYNALGEQLQAVKDAASSSLSTPAIDRFLQHPLPSDRSTLENEILELQKEYIGKYHNDPVFHAKARLAANFLDQLESVHQIGDSQHAGFLLVALLEKGIQS